MVVLGFTGVPLVNKTKPPPLAFVRTQSPIPLVGEFARRSPSMPKPPAGAMTGAVPGRVAACAVDGAKARHVSKNRLAARRLFCVPHAWAQRQNKDCGEWSEFNLVLIINGGKLE